VPAGAALTYLVPFATMVVMIHRELPAAQNARSNKTESKISHQGPKRFLRLRTATLHCGSDFVSLVAVVALRGLNYLWCLVPGLTPRTLRCRRAPRAKTNPTNLYLYCFSRLAARISLTHLVVNCCTSITAGLSSVFTAAGGLILRYTARLMIRCPTFSQVMLPTVGLID
jgi:hypothetical protein